MYLSACSKRIEARIDRTVQTPEREKEGENTCLHAVMNAHIILKCRRTTTISVKCSIEQKKNKFVTDGVTI
jgi:hypothetical protein